MQISKDKTLGKISPDQFARTLDVMEGFEVWADLFALLKQKPRFKRLIESPRIGFSWSSAYEFEYKYMLAALMVSFAEHIDLKSLALAEDKQEFVLQMAENQEDLPLIGRVKARKILLVLGLLQAVTKSIECMSLYSISINELVARARKGDKEAILKAIKIDPTILSAPSVAHQLSLAVMRKDKRFLQRVKKAFDGPHKGLHIYKKLRYSALMLDEAGALTPSNREHVFDVVANQLKLYEQRKGDPFKGLFTQFSRWKEYSTT